MQNLKLNHKIAFGVGQMAEGIKNTSFETFLFFYYNQVLGLSGSLSGLAILIALVFDAVTDPATGSFSDSFQSRWGRRHPFMYISALPLAVTFCLLFTPPSGLGEWGLFAWLTIFAMLVRGSMTLYHIPHLALGAELSGDYNERTGIVGYRTFFGAVGGVGVHMLGFFYFLRSTADFEHGQMNPSGYPDFALFFAGVILVTVLYSAAGTHSRIPYLPRPPDNPDRFSFRRLGREMTGALSSPSFRALFVGLVIFFVARGVQFALLLYMNTYFWELSTRQMGLLMIPAIFGLLSGIPIWTLLSRRIDKRTIFLTGIIIFSLFSFLPPVLRLWFWFPANEQILLLLMLLGTAWFLTVFGAAGAFVAAGSMLADLADEYELVSGRRQEGIFFGAQAFAGKSASGLGHQIAGWCIDLIQLSPQADPGAVAPDVVHHLGILYGPGVFILSIIAFGFLWRYRLTRERHAEIQHKLARKESGHGFSFGFSRTTGQFEVGLDQSTERAVETASERDLYN